MKRSKLFSTLFIIVCIISLCASVSAAGLEETHDVSFTVEASASTVSSTGTFKVTVAVDKNDGFKYAKPVLTYDPNQLTLVSNSTSESAFKTSSGSNAVTVQEVSDQPGKVSIMIGSFSDMTNSDAKVFYGATGTVVVFEFKPAEGLAAGTKIKIDLDVDPVNVMHPNKLNNFEESCNVTDDSLELTYVIDTAHTCKGEEVVPGKPATCTEPGLTDGKKCSICGEIYVAQTEIPALGHTEVKVPGTPATCTTEGRKDFIFCSVCEVTIQAAETIPALDHQWVAATCTTPKTCSVCSITEGTVAGHKTEVIPEVKSTCSVAGTSAGEKCTVCGIVTKEPTKLELAEHKYETVPGKAATCTTTGLTDGIKCSVCGDVKKAQTEIKRLGHTIETIPGTAATCTTEGRTSGEKCSVCNAILLSQSAIPATGHDYSKWTDAGDHHKQVCSNCGDTKTADHSWDAGVVVKEPAENLDGEKKFTCADCGATKTQVIPGLNHEHKYSSSVTDPTCTEDGCVVYTCACGDTYTEAGDPAFGHSWVEATCTDAKYCSVCNTVEGEALGHSFGEWVFMEEPTATTEGSKTRTCSVCGETETETIPATGEEPTPTTQPGTSTPNGTDEPNGNSNTILIVAIVALFVAAGAIIVLLVLKKK